MSDKKMIDEKVLNQFQKAGKLAVDSTKLCKEIFWTIPLLIEIEDSNLDLQQIQDWINSINQISWELRQAYLYAWEQARPEERRRVWERARELKIGEGE